MQFYALEHVGARGQWQREELLVSKIAQMEGE